MENGEVTDLRFPEKNSRTLLPYNDDFVLAAKDSTRARRVLWHAAMHLHRDHAHAWPKNVG